MKIVKHDLGNEFQEVKIISLGDLHVGDPDFDKDLLEKTIKQIKDTSNMYLTLNGDLINNSVRDSVGDVYAEAMSPQEQLDLLVEYFEPIKDKILGITRGNHCERTQRQTGLDITKIFAQRLGIEHVYTPEQALIYVSFGKNRNREDVRHTFSVFLTHIGGTKARLSSLSEIVDADIFLRGHYHQIQVLKMDVFKTDIRYKTLTAKTQLFAQNGACLKYGGYGAMAGYRPGTAVFPIISVNITTIDKNECLDITANI